MCLNFKIYTPPKIVRKLLKLCNYGGKEILKKHVVDNSCGDGAILEQVVLEYIKIANKQNFTRQQINLKKHTFMSKRGKVNNIIVFRQITMF